MPKGKPNRFGPQAKDDDAVTSENRGVQIDVLANDAGGAAKQLWSVDQANPANAATYADLPGGAAVGFFDGQLLYKPNHKFDYLQEGEIAYDSFTYTIRLANGSFSVATVEILIVGSNTPAELSPVIVSLTEGDDAAAISASGQLTIFDVDSPETFIAATLEGRYGTFTLEEDGDWTYLANGPHDEFVAGKTYKESFVVASADGTTTTVDFRILGTSEGMPTAGLHSSGDLLM